MIAPKATNLGLTALAAILFAATIARAQSAPAAPPVPPAPSSSPPAPLPPTPNVTLSEDEILESHRGGIPPGSFVWHRWVLFDPYLDTRALNLTGGPVWERADDSNTKQGGVALALGPSIETHRSVFFVRGQVEFGFRYTGADHLVVNLGQYAYSAGLSVGPVEIGARVGATIAEVHFGRGGFGLGFLSPMVGAGAAVTLGGLRLGITAFHEYSWRWTSGPGDHVEGFLIDLAIVQPPRPAPARFRVEP